MKHAGALLSLPTQEANKPVSGGGKSRWSRAERRPPGPLGALLMRHPQGRSPTSRVRRRNDHLGQAFPAGKAALGGNALLPQPHPVAAVSAAKDRIVITTRHGRRCHGRKLDLDSETGCLWSISQARKHLGLDDFPSMARPQARLVISGTSAPPAIRAGK